MINFTLPSLGADMDEGKLVEWKIKPGDSVKRGQIVAVIETSKAAIEIEIWNDGTVHELMVQPGQTVPVGAVLATLLAPGEKAETAKPAPEVPAEAATMPMPPAAKPSIVPAAASAGRLRVSPAARRRAEEVGVSLEMLVGSGPDGAVTLEDVERAVAGKEKPSQAVPAGHQTEMRKAIAAAMSRSKREIPHYYLSESVPMQKAQQWLAAANEQRVIQDRLLMAVLQLKAVALAARKFPDMSGSFSNGEFMPSSAVHVGVAISLRQGGLIAPAIHDVADKTLDDLMRDLTDLVKRTRAGSLRSSEITDPTITVTNLGEQGVETVYGVIYPPQVALVGFGRITDRPWAENGIISAMPVTTASLAADHRVSDGHRGGLFLAAIRDLLQRPEEW